MQSNLIVVLFVLILSDSVLSVLNGRLYGINQTSKAAWFGMIENESKTFDQMIDLGEVWFASGPSATRGVNSEQYMIVYLRDTILDRNEFHLLTVDVTSGQKPKILSNIKLDKSTNGSFIQISDDDKQLVGMREIAGTRAQIELATINKTNGRINVTGFYPYGSDFFHMVFARERRLYYILHGSKLIYGINVDTGNIDIDILIPNGYSLQGLTYDSVKNRLLSFIYSVNFTESSYVLAEILIENNSTNIRFQPIGNPIIPYVGYAWFSIYTLAVKERQLITVWLDDETSNFLFISTDIDNGNVVTNQTMSSAWNFIGLVYFD